MYNITEVGFDGDIIKDTYSGPHSLKRPLRSKYKKLSFGYLTYILKNGLVF